MTPTDEEVADDCDLLSKIIRTEHVATMEGRSVEDAKVELGRKLGALLRRRFGTPESTW